MHPQSLSGPYASLLRIFILYSERSRESSKHYCRKFGAADADSDADTDLGGAGGSRWRRLANDKTSDLAERRPGPGFMDNPWMSDIK